MREAAALPLVTITAYMAVHERMRVKPGMHVLIHGGAGGVGHVAIQLAKAAGATVSTTVSTETKAQIAKAMGADNIIYYRSEPVDDYVQLLTDNGFDAVFDTVGGANLDNSFAAARPESVVASTNTRSTHDLSILHAKGLTLSVIFMLLPMITNEGRERYSRILEEARALAENGKLKPLMDYSKFTLKDAAEAQTLVENGKSLGKVVIKIES